MDRNILVLAYPGTGKTYIADNYEDVSDIELPLFYCIIMIFDAINFGTN